MTKKGEKHYEAYETKEAREIEVGDHIVLNEKPCKVSGKSTTATGKSGLPRCYFTAKDIFTGESIQHWVHHKHTITVVDVKQTEYEILNIDDDFLVLEGYDGANFDLSTHPPELATQITDAWAYGENEVRVTVVAAVGIEQVVSFEKL